MLQDQRVSKRRTQEVPLSKDLHVRVLVLAVRVLETLKGCGKGSCGISPRPLVAAAQQRIAVRAPLHPTRPVVEIAAAFPLVADRDGESLREKVGRPVRTIIAGDQQDGGQIIKSRSLVALVLEA